MYLPLVVGGPGGAPPGGMTELACDVGGASANN